MARVKAKTGRHNAWTIAITALLLLLSLTSAGRGQPPRQPRAATVLQAARECYARGDYDSAAVYYQQLEARRGDLSDAEQKDLGNLINQNNIALQDRRSGEAQLHQADEALRQGRRQQAASLVKALTTNQYLSPADRQQLSQLNDRLRADGVTVTARTAPAKGDAKTLLASARSALQRGELDEAEQLADQADKASAGGLPAWLHPWSDTPAKVRRDVQTARTRLAAQPRDTMPRPAEPDLTSKDPGADKSKKENFTPLQTVKNLIWKTTPPTPPATGDKVNPPVPDLRARPAPEPAATNTTTVVMNPSLSSPDAAARPRETSPKVGANTVQARLLIQEGYRALEARELTRARQMAEQARALRPELSHGEKTPADLLADIQTPATVVKTGFEEKPRPATPPLAPLPPPGSLSKEQATALARQLIQDGYKALQGGDVNKARLLAEQARDLRPELKFWEDNPEKLVAEINLQSPLDEQAAKVKPPAAGNKEPGGDVQASARTLLKQGRDLYTQGKLDEAEKMCQQAASLSSARWGLFEDSPEKLRLDIQKIRTRRDREESTQLLAEARRLFAQGKLKDAKERASLAKIKHGAYTLWEPGDRADTLLAEIETAEMNQRIAAIPSLTGPAPQGQAVPPPPVPPSATLVPPVPPAPPSVAEVKPTVPQPVAPVPSPVPQVSQAVPPAPTLLEVQTRKTQARQRAVGLLAEARTLQKQDKLVEAQAKALEARTAMQDARNLGVMFAPDEDTPEIALLNLSALCGRRVLNLLQRAEEAAALGAANPARLQEAERDLARAGQLAKAFGQDVSRIEQKTAWLRNLQSGAANGGTPRPPVATVEVPPPPQPEATVEVPPPPTPPVGEPSKVADNRPMGLRLRDDILREIQRGQTISARKMAEELFGNPSYGMQEEAAQLLRTIDAEEFNQQILVSNRNADAVRDAFLRKNYTQALNIFRGVNMKHLSPERQAQLKEMLSMPEMQTAALGNVPRTLTVPIKPGVETPGRATASDDPSRVASAPRNPGAGDGFADKFRAMEEVLFMKLREEGRQVQIKARDTFVAGNRTRALEMLEEYNTGLRDAQLDPDKVVLLRKPVERRLQEFRTLKAQADFETAQREERVKGGSGREDVRTARGQKKQEQVAELMKRFEALATEGKYKEADILLAQAKEIDPDNLAVDAAQRITRLRDRMKKIDDMKGQKEDYFNNALDFPTGEPLDVTDPIRFSKDNVDRLKKRGSFRDGIYSLTRNEKERAIEQKLTAPINLNFKDTPLKQVIDDLHSLSGLNVIPDTAALNDASISLDQPLSLKVENISLKSALNILLKKVHLTYVVKDEVLQITTVDAASGKLKQVTYPVADLVVPVENHSLPVINDLSRTLERFNESQVLGPHGVMPYNPKFGLPGGNAVSTMGSQESAASVNGGPSASSQTSVTRRSANNTMEDLLIKLITSTVAPESWSEVGGKGTIQYFPLGLGLVVNQTQDIQEQVADLLAALRRLQDLEVSIEMRMISVSEAFFERMGLDFDINVVTPNSRFIPQLTTGNFQQFPFVNRFTPDRFVSGLTPAGTYTPDLNVPLRNSSFDFSVPTFGGFPGTLGADGGLSLGLAFLSDIQVFMFMEAAQGDRRTNTMQAPRVTVFNGQTATLSVNDQQFFLLGVNINTAADQIFFTPQNQAVPLGVNLTVTPVVSADRRFVRMSLNPTMQNLASANVPLIPVQIPVPNLFQDNFNSQQPVIFQMFFQQPTFSQISVNTTVTVPDGGTVLLGGLKTLSEARNEFGPPILSKIPYINRLFKNVGYGREAQSLMIMVTPRIIINEEEEQIFLGQIPPLPPAR